MGCLPALYVGYSFALILSNRELVLSAPTGQASLLHWKPSLHSLPGSHVNRVTQSCSANSARWVQGLARFLQQYWVNRCES